MVAYLSACRMCDFAQQPDERRCQNVCMADRIEIQRFPPGNAKGAKLYHWQFGGYKYGMPFEIGTAQRIADGDLKPYELAILDVVLNHETDIPQRELESVLSARTGATHAQVYLGAQRLAKHGCICRKKIHRQWHYAKPGYSWIAAARSTVRSSKERLIR